MFNIDKTRTAPRAVVTKNNVHNSQANLDFSEEAVTGNQQHEPINNGQVNLTNQDGSTANLDYSTKTVTRGTTRFNNNINNASSQKTVNTFPFQSANAEPTTFNVNGNPLLFGNNSTVDTPPPANSTDIPAPEPTPTPPQVETKYQSIDDLGFTQGTIDPKTGVSTTGGNAFSFTPIDTKVFAVQMGSNNKPIGGNQFNSGKMSEAMYNTKISNQKRDSISSLPSMQGWENLGTPDKKVKLNQASFFSGTKSGNETFTDNNIKMKDGTQSQTKGYADVNPFEGTFNDPFNVSTETFSNEKKNKKALQDQFNMYSDFSNF